MKSLALILALLMAVVVANAATDPNQASRVLSLPGYTGTIPFVMYSGYVTVDPSHGRALFYWFIQSQNNPATDPVVLWLQGGPGCSSLLGLFAENGPFRVENNGSVSFSPFSWNRLANMLYVESPAGVGFSYSNTTTDYNTDNAKTTADTYTFLTGFFQQYQQFQTNDFYITGESYSGDYIPLLAQAILDGSNSQLKKSFKGFMIGNPVISCPNWKAYRDSVQIDLYYYHGMIPYSLYSKWLKSGCQGQSSHLPAHCLPLIAEMRVGIGHIQPDNLYQNFCTGNATLDITVKNPGCITLEEHMTAYLNRPDVQEAIHARKPKSPWRICVSDLHFNYTSDFPDMLPYYRQFFAQAPYLRIIIYSGDVDIATCPHAYTQMCLAELDSPITSQWRPWVIDELQQIAGYIEGHEHYTFITVKGAGHEVPQYAPMPAFMVFSHFIKGTPLPATSKPYKPTGLFAPR